MKRALMVNTIFWFLTCSSIHAQELKSGLEVGAECPACDPHHVSGPDKNRKVCPMCKYGSRQGLMLWMNDTDWKSLQPVLARMEKEIQSRGLRNFRVFVMYMNPKKKPLNEAIREAREEANRLNMSNVALTVIPRPDDPETAGVFRINPDSRIKNTVLVYSRRKVAYNTLNLTEAGVNDLLRICDKLLTSDPLY